MHNQIVLEKACFIFSLMQFQVVDDHRAGKIVVNLTGRLNKCGVISPRYVFTFLIS